MWYIAEVDAYSKKYPHCCKRMLLNSQVASYRDEKRSTHASFSSFCFCFIRLSSAICYAS